MTHAIGDSAEMLKYAAPFSAKRFLVWTDIEYRTAYAQRVG